MKSKFRKTMVSMFLWILWFYGIALFLILLLSIVTGYKEQSIKSMLVGAILSALVGFSLYKMFWFIVSLKSVDAGYLVKKNAHESNKQEEKFFCNEDYEEDLFSASSGFTVNFFETEPLEYKFNDGQNNDAGRRKIAVHKLLEDMIQSEDTRKNFEPHILEQDFFEELLRKMSFHRELDRVGLVLSRDGGGMIDVKVAVPSITNSMPQIGRILYRVDRKRNEYSTIQLLFPRVNIDKSTEDHIEYHVDVVWRHNLTDSEIEDMQKFWINYMIFMVKVTEIEERKVKRWRS